MVKSIIFDIGKVLVSFDWDILAKKVGFTDEEIGILAERVIGSRWDELDRGVMTEEEAVKYIQEAIPGMEEKFAELWNRVEEAIDVFPYVEGWMKKLKEEGYNIYLLSNFPKNLFIEEEKKFGFMKYVDGKIISSFVQLIKPDREIYLRLLSEYGLNAPECVFIDDRPRNIQAAEELGINGIVFESYEKASAGLDELLKKLNR